MRKNVFKLLFIYILVIFQFMTSYAFAVDDSVSIQDAQLVTSICYNDIEKRAKEHSYDLQIADFNILISKQGVKGARSEYFPKLIL